MRSAFLMMCQFYSPMHGSVPFGGWNSGMMMHARPQDNLKSYPTYRQTMLTLAKIFLALGDLEPALACIQVLDFVPGQSHHDLATIYRVMCTVRETHPQGLAVVAYTGESAERYRLELAYRSRTRDEKPGDRVPPPDVFWLNHALKEYEQSVGREHPDTLNALQVRARQKWLYQGPEKAEPTLRDAWSRAVDLSDKVLPGLPEVQTYQFLEVNQPPADQLLSLFRATKKDHARDAYEVVWRSKALATRQIAERRHLGQAASGRPELARLADELQITRQRLASVSLSVPTNNAVEQRRKQMAELTGRKEDLEREIARQSEPFRRAQTASRTSAADLVRSLPPQTVVVDLIERWEWTPPAVNVFNHPPPSPTSNDPKEVSEPEGPSRASKVPKVEFRLAPSQEVRTEIKRKQGPGSSQTPSRPRTAPQIKKTSLQVQKGAPQMKKGAAQKKSGATQKKRGAAQKKKAARRKNESVPFPLPPEVPVPPPLRTSKPWVRKRCYDAFVLRPDNGEPGWLVKWVELGDADALDHLLDGWIASVRPGGRADRALAQQSRDRLWKPIEAALGGCQTVILIPDGRLAQVPWNALPGKRPDSYLIEDYAIAQSPYGQYVARLLTDPRRQATASCSSAALTMDRQGSGRI